MCSADFDLTKIIFTINVYAQEIIKSILNSFQIARAEMISLGRVRPASKTLSQKRCFPSREKHLDLCLASITIKSLTQVVEIMNYRDDSRLAYHALWHDLTFRIQNPNIPQSGRVRAPGGAAVRVRARLNANRIIRQGNKKNHRSLQGIDERSLQRLSRSTNKRNPM